MSLRLFLLRGVLTIAILAGCGDPSGPGASGPLFANVTIDGQRWRPTLSQAFLQDTIAAIGFQRTTGVIVEGLLIEIHNFHGPGDYALGTNTLTTSSASFLIDDSPNTPTLMATSSARPGRVTVTGFSAADSTIAGTFSFPVFIPGNDQPRHSFAGSFRVQDAF